MCSLLRLTAGWVACAKTERLHIFACRVGIFKISDISQQANYRTFSSSAISKHVGSRGDIKPKVACMLTNTVSKNLNNLPYNCLMQMQVYYWKRRNRSNCFPVLRGDARLNVEAHVLACAGRLQQSLSSQCRRLLEVVSCRSATGYFAYREIKNHVNCLWIFNCVLSGSQPSIKLAWTNS